MEKPYTIAPNDDFTELPLEGYAYYRGERLLASEIMSETQYGASKQYGIVLRMESEPTLGETRFGLARVAFDQGKIFAGSYRLNTHLLNQDGAPIEASRFMSQILYPAGFWEPVLTRAPFRFQFTSDDVPRILSVYAIDGYVIRDPRD